MQCFSNLFW